jgi:hypothetical protein
MVETMTAGRDPQGRFLSGPEPPERIAAAEAAALARNTLARPPEPQGKIKPQSVRAGLQTKFLYDLAEDWRLHGIEAIRCMRVEKPTEYVKVVASLMPKEVELDLASYVARVPINVVDLDEWSELNQDLITHKPHEPT